MTNVKLYTLHDNKCRAINLFSMLTMALPPLNSKNETLNNFIWSSLVQQFWINWKMDEEECWHFYWPPTLLHLRVRQRINYNHLSESIYGPWPEIDKKRCDAIFGQSVPGRGKCSILEKLMVDSEKLLKWIFLGHSLSYFWLGEAIKKGRIFSFQNWPSK